VHQAHNALKVRLEHQEFKDHKVLKVRLVPKALRVLKGDLEYKDHKAQQEHQVLRVPKELKVLLVLRVLKDQ
jgi:hypothetical protein